MRTLCYRLLFLILLFPLVACTPQTPAKRQSLNTNQSVQMITYGDELVYLLPSDRFFYVNSDNLRPTAYATLDKLANALKGYSSNSIVISAYTDDVGSVPFNKNLSLRQALRIKAYLWKQGLHSNRMQTRGYGSSHQVATNRRVEGSRMNRRVEIRVKA